MRILIYVGKFEDMPIAKLLVNRLRESNIEVFGMREEEIKGLNVPKWDESPVDMALVFGGDGTVLKFIHEVDGSGEIPILHVGTGRVNYLSDCSTREVPQIVDRLTKGEYYIEERLTLKAVSGDFTCTALNEVLMKGIDPGHLISVTVIEEGGEEIMRARMDGVIVSTPTGSTAYALAAGGPMVDPRLSVKLIVPLAPFSRALVPIVHPFEVPIKVITSEVSYVICDGVVSQRGAEVRIVPGERKVRFVRTRHYNPYEKLWRRLFTQ
ncbi:NAD(+)/NADH kinase [Vulcanisaeta thermophila]|uniref:NAD(+)/NADH kinase n=1 Tax=Vulcanisaeta thermophila TaxID=867917 RepID=UPI000852C1FD|nr:NAD(+)/NADH kinase [Vulcanisaeta thermophila]